MTALESRRGGRPAHPIVFSDFDGTITLSDVTDEILSRLAAPGWQEIERLWIDGKIGSRECLERQLALVETSAQELNALIDSIPLDPGFHNFVRFTEKSRIPFVVLSDGLDCVIRRVLAHADLHFRPRNGSHFFSTSGRLVNGRMRVSFPHAVKSCTHGCATCKPRIIQKLKRGHWPVIYAGDGLSDRHAVAEADFVYARQPLLDLCREKDIPCRPFDNFKDVQDALGKWLDGEAAQELDEAARGREAWLREQAVEASL
ncbi:MAG TPA: MtnX-like HAD-IB family phosphatase [Terriglobia bacterium]|nr:MtnX-like HAD-IB family phosphatase [Terriglobia bacterium]